MGVGGVWGPAPLITPRAQGHSDSRSLSHTHKTLKPQKHSGGENISSIEVENVLHQHPAISEAAVSFTHFSFARVYIVFHRVRAAL